MRAFRIAFEIVFLVIIFVAGAIFGQTFARQPQSQNCSVAWYGDTDLTMLKQVRQDLISTANCKVTSVSLLSSGGPVLTSIEIAKEVRRAQANGRIVKIHGRTLVASGAVLVLGSGTKGYRVVDTYAFTLVHGIQVSAFLDLMCVSWDDNPVTRAALQNQIILRLYVQELMTVSGQSLATVKTWIACNKEYAGLGPMLVEMGLADAAK